MNILDLIYKPFKTFIITIIIVGILHWILVQIFTTYCSEWSIFGPIYSILSLGNPICHAVNHLQLSLANNYITIWSSAVISLIGWINLQINK